MSGLVSWVAHSASGTVLVLGELPVWMLDQMDDWMANWEIDAKLRRSPSYWERNIG